MARASLESAKNILGFLTAEHERDREFVQGLLAHTVKTLDHLAVMREQEERRIDEEAAERKAEFRRLFNQLIAAESERQQRLEKYLADLEGQYEMEAEDQHHETEDGDTDEVAN